MRSCPVAVQFTVEFIVSAIHINSFCIEVYGVGEFSLLIFCITFVLVHLSYS